MVSASLAATLVLLAHPVPDGVIFRSLEIVVRNQEVDVRYQLGLSDAMVRRELQRLGAWDETESTDAVASLARYRDRVQAEIAAGLAVTLNQRPVAVELVSADIVRQPHTQLELIYRFSLPARRVPLHFLLIDENFRGTPGYHVAAIRSRGNVIVEQRGADPLPQRVPYFADAGQPGWLAPPPARRAEAVFITEAAGTPSGTGPPAGTKSREVDADLALAAVDRKSDDPTAAESSTADDSATNRPQRVLETPWVWTTVFAALGLTVAAAWLAVAWRTKKS